MRARREAVVAVRDPLHPLAESAIRRVRAQLRRHVPRMAPRVTGWMQQLAGSGRSVDYFLQADRFPLLHLPLWLERAIRGRIDPGLQRELVYSSINGYYFIRLLDNVMDGHATVERGLLPASAFFHSEFEGVYRRLFAPDSPFWADYHDAWYSSWDVVAHEATLGVIDRRAFDDVAAHKMDAVRIPLAAVCHHHDRLDLLPRWTTFVAKLAAFEQLQDDLFDWHRDLRTGQRTFFLSQADRRRRAGESPAAWVVRDGFAWGATRVLSQAGGLRRAAARLDSAAAGKHVESRLSRFQRRHRQLAPAVATLARLADAFREPAR